MTPEETPALGLLSQEQLYEEFGDDWDTVAKLYEEFDGDWAIGRNPGGLRMWTALHSEDRSERYIVARHAGELLAKLRAIRNEDTP
jgi:hypothetical protein